ncbi:MAG TPA: uridine kinase [Gemmatimonadetes bacterium]|nr:uridine kinase [Gemmatimonadota bacterium]
MSVRPVIVGVAGGSGSGKSTIVAELVRLLGLGITTVIRHDWYYRDLSHLELDDRTEVNFDHPSSLETELLVKHVMTLISGCPVDAPSYNFSTHTRSSVTIQLEPSQVLILDGILALAHEQLRQLMDICVFVDTDVEKRLERRLERDSGERGRSSASVIQQFESTVLPMHNEFVEPSRAYADIMISGGHQNSATVKQLAFRVQELLAERTQ